MKIANKSVSARLNKVENQLNNKKDEKHLLEEVLSVSKEEDLKIFETNHVHLPESNL